jgi:hypothetical protein
MQEVKVGSVWTGSGFSDTFTVIHRITLDGNVWVHYRNQQGQEFSCYEDAFLVRFREHANDHR